MATLEEIDDDEWNTESDFNCRNNVYLDHYDDSFEICGYRFKTGKTCGQPTHGLSECEQCGKPLCMMHAESGGQFCDSCPTEDYDPMKLMEDEIV